MGEAVLTCFECGSTTLEWVGHREVVRCMTCGNIWEPRGESSRDHVRESIDQERQVLPEKGDAFKPYTLQRLNGIWTHARIGG